MLICVKFRITIYSIVRYLLPCLWCQQNEKENELVSVSGVSNGVDANARLTPGGPNLLVTNRRIYFLICINFFHWSVLGLRCVRWHTLGWMNSCTFRTHARNVHNRRETREQGTPYKRHLFLQSATNRRIYILICINCFRKSVFQLRWVHSIEGMWWWNTC